MERISRLTRDVHDSTLPELLKKMIEMGGSTCTSRRTLRRRCA